MLVAGEDLFGGCLGEGAAGLLLLASWVVRRGGSCSRSWAAGGWNVALRGVRRLVLVSKVVLAA